MFSMVAVLIYVCKSLSGWELHCSKNLYPVVAHTAVFACGQRNSGPAVSFMWAGGTTDVKS